MTARSRKRTKPEPVTVITSGGTIRFEEPKSGRQPKANPAVVIVQENNPVTGFVSFLREHAVVGLAIGFIVGQQANGLVKLLVDDFISPLFQLLFGEPLNARTLTLNWHERSVPFAWGSFANGVLSFLFVLVAIYIIVKILNLDKLDKPADDKK